MSVNEEHEGNSPRLNFSCDNFINKFINLLCPYAIKRVLVEQILFLCLFYFRNIFLLGFITRIRKRIHSRSTFAVASLIDESFSIIDYDIYKKDLNDRDRAVE